ncbi:MAG: EFR1 family ferrodoxin [Clostridia bacterium]|nr:EFR1 family ferrodoxin [Clostridia bacterium]
MCTGVCPARNIDMQDSKPKFRHECEHCLACIHWCPNRAINYKKATQKRRRYHHPDVNANEIAGID